MRLLAELKRRKVIRVAGLYLVTAWLLVQVAETLLPIFGTPDWVLRALVLLLALGFVPALVFSWAFELTPDGLRRDDGAKDPALREAGNRRLDIATIAIVVLALGVLALDRLTTDRAAGNMPVATITPAQAGNAGVDASPAAPTLPDPAVAPAKSIAVLAFVNMSGDKENEYFSDGIAEEILNALVKVDDLKVAGRTSSFYYKGKEVPLATIGSELGVAHVLEGSVRRQGDKVRITAQLIQVKDGFHLWSETYDGDLVDVFELQERIAREITGSLKLVLSGDQQRRLVPVATTDPVAYSNFLQATSIFNRRDRARIPEAIALLEEAIRLDPKFARAQARLGALHAIAPEYVDADLVASNLAALEHAHAALELDPEIAEAWTVIAYVHGARGDLVVERESYEKALAIDPDDVLTNFWNAISYVRAGQLEEAVGRFDRVLELDPMLPNGLTWRGWMYEYAGDVANGRRTLVRALDLGIQNAHLPLAMIEHRAGDDAKARSEMMLGLEAFGAGLRPDSPEIISAGVYGDDAARQRAVEHLRTLLAEPGAVPGPVPYALIMLGEPALAMDVILERPMSSQLYENRIWHPDEHAFRQQPRFAEFARKTGYAALWDQVGPPSNCRKEGNDYACE